MSKIIQLYSDKNKTIKAYPKTLASQVYMDDGTTTINSQLDSIQNKVDNATQIDDNVVSTEKTWSSFKTKAIVDEVAQKGTTVETIKNATKEQVDKYIQDGTIANMRIEDGSISKEKLDSDLLNTIENPIMPNTAKFNFIGVNRMILALSFDTTNYASEINVGDEIYCEYTIKKNSNISNFESLGYKNSADSGTDIVNTGWPWGTHTIIYQDDNIIRYKIVATYDRTKYYHITPRLTFINESLSEVLDVIDVKFLVNNINIQLYKATYVHNNIPTTNVVEYYVGGKPVTLPTVTDIINDKTKTVLTEEKLEDRLSSKTRYVKTKTLTTDLFNKRAVHAFSFDINSLEYSKLVLKCKIKALTNITKFEFMNYGSDVADKLGSPVGIKSSSIPQFKIGEWLDYEFELNINKTNKYVQFLLLPFYGDFSPMEYEIENVEMILDDSLKVTEYKFGLDNASVDITTIDYLLKYSDLFKDSESDIGIDRKLSGLKNKLLNRKDIVIGCIGDSTTMGDTGAGVTQQNYPYFLGEYLKKIYDYTSDNKITIVNPASGGNSSSLALPQAQTVVNHGAELVLISFGINDASGVLNQYTETTIVNYRNNLKKAITFLKSSGKDIILMPPIPTFSYNCVNNKAIYTIGRVCEDLAYENNITYIDIHKELMSCINEGVFPNSIYSDFVHMKPSGYNLFGGLVACIISEELCHRKTTNTSYVPLVANICVNTDYDRTKDITSNNSILGGREIVLSATSTATYYKINLFINKPNTKIKIIGSKKTNGGIINLRNNGEVVCELDFTSNQTIYNNEFIIYENTPIGVNQIEFNKQDFTKDGVVSISNLIIE